MRSSLARLGFAAYVWLSAGQLNEQVATHFGLDGQPNGWQTHAGYLRWTPVFPRGGSRTFVLSIFALRRLGRGAGMIIPHKEYWLAPERQSETFAFIQRKGTWLAGLLLGFFAGMHYLILVANAHSPISLSPAFTIWVVGPFLVASGIWVVSLYPSLLPGKKRGQKLRPSPRATPGARAARCRLQRRGG